MSAADAPPVCADCKFWVQTEEEHGSCRRRSPTVHAVATVQEADGNVYAMWPLTHALDWCGELELKP